MEEGGRKVEIPGGERVEMEADYVGTLLFDLELVGGGAGEDPSRPEERRGSRRRVRRRRGDRDLGARGPEDGGRVGVENAAVVEGGGGGRSAGDEVVTEGREAGRGEGEEQREKVEKEKEEGDSGIPHPNGSRDGVSGLGDRGIVRSEL